MVECEFAYNIGTIAGLTSFNRYMVECESFEYYINSFCFTVLIDTWWNVNIVACGGLAWYIKVLIDTWWNVNVARDSKLKQAIGFNRYMVECEFVRYKQTTTSLTGFNRYMVECE